MENKPYGQTLSSIVECAAHLRQVSKESLHPGARVIVKTDNSVYTIQLLNDGDCRVSGGWFDRKGLSPTITRIVGCTWGGSAVKVDVLAACGLRLEFSNRVVTTVIRKIFILPSGSDN